MHARNRTRINNKFASLSLSLFPLFATFRGRGGGRVPAAQSLKTAIIQIAWSLTPRTFWRYAKKEKERKIQTDVCAWNGNAFSPPRAWKTKVIFARAIYISGRYLNAAAPAARVFHARYRRKSKAALLDSPPFLVGRRILRSDAGIEFVVVVSRRDWNALGCARVRKKRRERKQRRWPRCSRRAFFHHVIPRHNLLWHYAHFSRYRRRAIA